MYHSVTDGEPIDPYSVSRKVFSDQVSWLIDQDYQFMSLAALVQSKKNSMFAKGRKQVVLTFDDGYRDFLINVLPILLRHQLPATVFLVTDMLGQTATWNNNDPTALLMSEAEVRQLHAHGINLGSHTLTHADLTTVADKELQQQLVTSRIALADFGETFFSFSYPWSRHTDREVAALKAAGYECAVTVDGSINFSKTDSFRLGRLTMHRDLDLESFKRMIVSHTWLQRNRARFRTLVRRVLERVFLTR